MYTLYAQLKWLFTTLFYLSFYIHGGCGSFPPLEKKLASSLRNGKVDWVNSAAKFMSAVASNCSMFIISSIVGLKN